MGNNPQEKFKVQVDINGAGFTDISSEISLTLHGIYLPQQRQR